MVSTVTYFNLEEEVTTTQPFPTILHEIYFTVSSIPVCALSETSCNSVMFQSNSRSKNRW